MTEAIDNASFLTTIQAAARLNVAPTLLRQWRYRGVGPAWVKTGPGVNGSVVYREADLLIYLRAATHLTDRMPKFGGGRLPGGKNKPKVK